MRKSWLIFTGSVIAALLVASMPTARADVLVSRPRTPICYHLEAIKTGVWWNGEGPKWYRIRIVRKATGNVVFSRSGKATNQWRFFHFIPEHRGWYKVRYKVSGGIARFRVHAVACSSE